MRRADQWQAHIVRTADHGASLRRYGRLRWRRTRFRARLSRDMTVPTGTREDGGGLGVVELVDVMSSSARGTGVQGGQCRLRPVVKDRSTHRPRRRGAGGAERGAGAARGVPFRHRPGRCRRCMLQVGAAGWSAARRGGAARRTGRSPGRRGSGSPGPGPRRRRPSRSACGLHAAGPRSPARRVRKACARTSRSVSGRSCTSGATGPTCAVVPTVRSLSSLGRSPHLA